MRFPSRLVWVCLCVGMGCGGTKGGGSAIETGATDTATADTAEAQDTDLDEDPDDSGGAGDDPDSPTDTSDTDSPVDPDTVDGDGDGYSVADGDCDDADALVYPGAGEVCNEKDDDCDSEIDEDPVFAEQWFRDSDGDGYGDPARSVRDCTMPPGFVAGGTSADDFDCNDEDDTIYPMAEELCDELDNDCDSAVDEDAADMGAWFIDADGDGYGAPGTAMPSCTPVPGRVANEDDCDDAELTVYLGAVEFCDGKDNDCDGEVDTDAEFGPIAWYRDADGDGFGDSTDSMEGCAGDTGYVDDGGDCDDDDVERHPGADELCDEVDNDCDGAVDEGDACP